MSCNNPVFKKRNKQKKIFQAENSQIRFWKMLRVFFNSRYFYFTASLRLPTDSFLSAQLLKIHHRGENKSSWRRSVDILLIWRNCSPNTHTQKPAEEKEKQIFRRAAKEASPSWNEHDIKTRWSDGAHRVFTNNVSSVSVKAGVLLIVWASKTWKFTSFLTLCWTSRTKQATGSWYSGFKSS